MIQCIGSIKNYRSAQWTHARRWTTHVNFVLYARHNDSQLVSEPRQISSHRVAWNIKFTCMYIYIYKTNWAAKGAIESIHSL